MKSDISNREQTEQTYWSALSKMVTVLLSMCLLLVLMIPSLAIAESAGHWFRLADLPEARQEILPVELDGKVYVIGGYTQTVGISEEVHVYDRNTDSWSQVASLPAARHHYAIGAIDGIIYVCGGYTTNTLPWSVTNTVYAYDPASDEWTERAPMNSYRGEVCCVVFEGELYVIGGNDNVGNDVGWVEKYNPASDIWTLISIMPTARHHSGAVVIDSLIYVAGGRTGYWNQQLTLTGALEAYSPASDTWYSLTSMLTPRSAIAAAAVGGKLYTFGGEIPGVYDEVEEYDPATSLWRSLTPMLTPRHGTGAVLFGDTVLIVGGSILEGIGTSGANECFVLGECTDSDFDGFADSEDGLSTCPVDNCPNDYNPDQADEDEDGIGDVCDSGCCGSYTSGYTGNVDCSTDGKRNLADITKLIDRVYVSKAILCCEEEGNVDGDATAKINLADITRLIDHVYVSKDETAVCK